MRKKILFCLLAGTLSLSSVSLCGAEAETETETASEAVSETGASELSDDLYSFQVKINDQIYQFPMSYADFTAMGWNYQDDETEEMAPNQYTPSAVFKNGDLKAYVSVVNLGINTLPISECLIGGIDIDQYQMEDAPDTTVEFPCGIVYGTATLDDVKAAYGEPSSVYEGSLYTNLSYEYDYKQSVDFYIDLETGVLNQFEVENFVVDEDANASAAAEVSADPTASVLAYTAPAELGDDLFSFTVDYAGALYQLPAPVSVFEENGWKIKENDSDSIVAGRDFGWVTMMKDNQEFHVIARNYDPNATVINNCFVTSVEASEYTANLPLTIQKGITVGMSQTDLEAALDGFNYEKDDDSDSFTYYTVESPDDSLDGFDIVVNNETQAVSSLEVTFEPDELGY